MISLECRMCRTNQLSRKRSVRFAETFSEIFEENLTFEEKSKCWYSGGEYKTFSKEIKKIISAVKKSKDKPQVLDDSEHCVRGINPSRKFRNEQKRLRATAIESVLLEQENQKRMGIKDDIGLRVIYSHFSKPAGCLAAAAAIQDEIEVEEKSTEELYGNMQAWQVPIDRTCSLAQETPSAA
mmetsp:Transcript_20438/g.31535  ORF Transcript_20438/g.31535 Transcript_20438/m.31535 type:complete len:182 (+) Transcript_20438:122-667(+)|eukprot:CAMPEP_0195291354 /NCGR_PEP_ID=MMETSP0707-20130614/7750_1 /TAXON_ID=33640 /ORGANISM="Asterionellopsis glacialis, Strain CCMP134" /LENGTH=181 /DNA_ID=CAMNT_0040351661 /DNA_START=87 /DNA_END=632 /DNA_ORIENTATION=-